MNKKRFILVISVSLLLLVGIVTCIFLLTKKIVKRLSNSTNLRQIVDTLTNEFEASLEVDEVIITLDSEKTETMNINNNINNVFKITTDLSLNYNNEKQEEIMYYPYINTNGLYSYKDEKGELVTKNTYDYAEFFFEEVATIRKNGLFGFVDKEFNNIIPCRYKDIISWGFQNGLAIILSQNDEVCVIDKQGKEIISGYYDNVDISYNGIIIVEKDDEIRYYNKNGKRLNVYKKYELYSEFENGIAEVWNEQEGIRYINENGDLIKIKGISEYGEFHNGTAILASSNGGNYITINKKFETVYLKDEYEFLYTSKFDDINCVVKKDTELGKAYVYIDNKGDILFESDYLTYEGFINGISPAYKEEKLYLIDLNGNPIKDVNYDSIFIVNKNLVMAVNDEYKWLMNDTGEIISESKYTDIYTEGEVIYAYKDYNYDFVDIYNSQGKLLGNFKSNFLILNSNRIFIFDNENKDSYGYYIEINSGKTIEFKDGVSKL